MSINILMKANKMNDTYIFDIGGRVTSRNHNLNSGNLYKQ